MVLVDLLQAFETVLYGVELIVIVLQDAEATVDDDPLVIDDQYSLAHVSLPLIPLSATSGDRVRGRVTRNVEPSPTSLSISIVPP